MRNQIIRILGGFFSLIKRLPIEWKIICFCLSSLGAIKAFHEISKIVVANSDLILRILIILGILLFVTGCCLYFLRFRRNQRELDSDLDDIDLIEESNSTQSRNIYTEGNYNESINGNYIEIQGDCININQDFSEVAAEIRELITQLKNQGYSQEDAEIKVADDLGEQARQKPKVRKKLFKWKKSFSRSKTRSNDETEVAREVVKTATTYRQTSSSHFTEVTQGTFQKLDDLLRAKKWEEADFETAKLIFTISEDKLPEDSVYRSLYLKYVRSEHITVIPRKNFNTINKLWLKHSGGRFGFSVQKDIWIKLGGASDTYYTPTEVKEKFGDEVGWRRKGEWLYYVDLYDLRRTKPRGHFPLMLMLRSGETDRCRVDFSILETIVGRIYKF
ncbi:MAG: GUN4 domain-containing protein [Mastigocoleus sp. MO_167.B18]|nr:GUN4 domain-containing protein [Mastigocoleus sp. MO_167.B18]